MRGSAGCAVNEVCGPLGRETTQIRGSSSDLGALGMKVFKGPLKRDRGKLSRAGRLRRPQFLCSFELGFETGKHSSRPTLDFDIRGFTGRSLEILHGLLVHLDHERNELTVE